jgi:ElaB/YqjD/DUF883 family membrane-anchored ribosome-binding protein
MSTRQRIEAESKRDPDALEREIELKRSEIIDIVNALEHKLSPGEVFERVLGYARGNGGEFFGNLGATIKANPLPAVLTSVGLVWLMGGPGRTRYIERNTSMGSAVGIGQRAAGMKQGLGDAADRGGDVGQHAGEMARAFVHKASEFGHTASESAHHAAESARQSAQQGAHDGRQSARKVRQKAHQVRESMDDLLAEQPIAVAAIGVAVGALLAALLPATRSEQVLMGQASQRVRQQVGEFAESGAQKAREFAREGIDKATQVAESGLQKSNEVLGDVPRRPATGNGGDPRQWPSGTAH